jgi:hypothetical protein
MGCVSPEGILRLFALMLDSSAVNDRGQRAE